MTLDHDEDRLRLAVLLFLAVPRRKLPTEAVVEKTLRGLFANDRSRAVDLAGALTASIDRAVAAGELVRNGARLALSEAGRERCTTDLGVKFPTRKSWVTLKRHLLAHALVPRVHTTEAIQRLSGANGMAAVVINEQERLITAHVPTSTQVADALAWRELGGDAGTKPSWPAARRLLLQRMLRAPSGTKERLLLPTLAARMLGATKSAPSALELAVLSRWTAPQLAPPAPFVSRVLAAAAAPGTARFGDNKAFIASVFETYQRDDAAEGWTNFGKRLVEAHLDGQLRLARADLIPAMNRELVDRSELTYQNATFHFVEIP